jgi:hypothetical protein
MSSSISAAQFLVALADLRELLRSCSGASSVCHATWLMSKVCPLRQVIKAGVNPHVFRHGERRCSYSQRVLPDVLEHQEEIGRRTSVGEQSIDCRDWTKASPRLL